jgi:hypothetical protein
MSASVRGGRCVALKQDFEHQAPGQSTKAKLYDTIIIRADHFSIMLPSRNNRVILPMVLLMVAFSLTSVQGILSTRQAETTLTETTTLTQTSEVANNYPVYSLLVRVNPSGG